MKTHYCPGKVCTFGQLPGCRVGRGRVEMEPVEPVPHSWPQRWVYRCPRCGVRESYEGEDVKGKNRDGVYGQMPDWAVRV